MTEVWSTRFSTAIWAAALLAPPAVAGVLVPFRSSLDGEHVSLILVLVVVGVSFGGLRVASAVSAVVAGLAYNFFWTEPYFTLFISDPGQVATVILLVLAGVAVGNLSAWAQRQQASAATRRGYLDELRAVSQPAEDGSAAVARIEAVSVALGSVLGAATVHYRPGVGPQRTLLHPDGSLTRSGRPVDVERSGLPTDDTITIQVTGRDGQPAHFLVSAASQVVRSSQEQRQVAAMLATMASADLTALP